MEGILNLTKDDNFTNRKTVKLIKQKKYYYALNIALYNTPKVHKLILITFYFLHRYCKIKLKINSIFTILKHLSIHNDFQKWIEYNQKRTSLKSYHLANKLLTNSINNNSVLLDIGCGFGIIRNDLLLKRCNVSYLGIDKCFSTLLTNRYFNPQYGLLICSNTDFSLPLKKKSVDNILILDTITNVHSPKNLIKECSRTLKNKGMVFIINIYNVTKTTFLWGYGINILNLKSWMKKYFTKIAFIKNQLSPNNEIVYINKVSANIFSYSCHATKKKP